MKKNDFGVFEIVLPPKDGQPAIPHNSKIKVRKAIEPKNGENKLTWKPVQLDFLGATQWGKGGPSAGLD